MLLKDQLRLFAFGYVDCRAYHLQVIASSAPLYRSRGMQIANCFMGMTNPEIQLSAPVLRTDPFQLRFLLAQIIRVNIRFPDLIGDRAATWSTIDFIHAIVPDKLVGRRIPFPNTYC